MRISGGTRLSRTIALALAVITLALYGPACRFNFIALDDTIYLTVNTHVRNGFTWPAIRWALAAGLFGESPDTDYWQPVTWLSRLLDIQLFGLNPGGHHLANVLLHTLNAVLLFMLLRRLTDRLWPAAFVAAVFAWHPVQVESVAWVTERKDVLSVLFGLLTVWQYSGYVRRPSLGRYLRVVGVFALALMSKPTIMMLPVLLCLLDYWPLDRLPGPPFSMRGVGKLLAEKLPLLLLSGLSYLITTTGMPTAFRHGSASFFLSYIPASYGWYMANVVWPTRLGLRSALPGLGFAPGEVVVAVVMLCGVTLLTLWQARQRRYLIAGWLWFVVALVPMVGLKPHEDRFTYLPIIGLLIAGAWAVDELVRRRSVRPATIAGSAALLVVACGVGTRIQLRHWQDSRALFSHSLAVTQDNWNAHNCLGMALLQSGELPAAIAQFREALRINPDCANAHHNLGLALAKGEKYEEALARLRETVRLEPWNAKAHGDLGHTLYRQGDKVAGLQHLLQAVRLKPDLAAPRIALAMILTEENRPAEAIEQYRVAVQSEPDSALAHGNLGLLLSQAGQIPAATAHLVEAIRLKPDSPKARCALGLIFAKRGDWPAATGQFTEALRLHPDFVEAHYNLGIVLAQQGQPAQAREHFATALRLKPDYQLARDALAKLERSTTKPDPR
jgi:protein O-mannosyl-transferase